MARSFYSPPPLRCGLCGELGQITLTTPGLRESLSMTIHFRAPNELRIATNKAGTSSFYFHEDCEAAKAGDGILA